MVAARMRMRMRVGMEASIFGLGIGCLDVGLRGAGGLLGAVGLLGVLAHKGGGEETRV